MAKTKISEFNSNPALNTDIDSINIAEGCAPSGINDAIRELMSQLKDWQAGTSNDPMVIGSSGSLTLNQGTANGVAYLNGSKVVTSGSALTFDGSKLTVKGGNAGQFVIDNSNEQYVQQLFQRNATVNTGADFLLDGSGNTFNFRALAANMPFTWNLSATAGAPSEQMRLTSTGLGIGTSSPSTKVEAAGNIKVSYASSGANASLISNNTSSTAGSMSQIIATNDASRALRIQYSSSGGAGGSALSGGFSGEVAQIFTDNAYPLSIGTSGVSWLNLSTTGNLGLGVTPSAWYSTRKAMQVGSAGVSIAGSTNLMEMRSNAYLNTSAQEIYVTSAAASLYAMNNGVHYWYNAPSGTAGNAITFTQAMTLDASGNLGVGTTSPSANGSGWHAVDVRGSTGGELRFGVDGGANFALYASASAAVLTSTSAIPIVFGNNNTERARIDSSGNLLVGTTSAYASSKLTVSTAGSNGIANVQTSSGGYCFISNAASNAGTFYHASFEENTTQRGSITSNGTVTAYNTTSDYRLKNITGALTGYKERLMSLQPKQGTWKADGSEFRGFLAHEFAQPYRASVTGEKDAVDAEGKPIMQAMQASSSEVMADLVAMVNELITENVSLKARLDAANL